MGRSFRGNLKNQQNKLIKSGEVDFIGNLF